MVCDGVSRARQVLHEYETRPHRLSRKPLVLLVTEQSQLVLPWKRVEGRLGILRSVGPRVCFLAPLCERFGTLSGRAARAASNALISSLGCGQRSGRVRLLHSFDDLGPTAPQSALTAGSLRRVLALSLVLCEPPSHVKKASGRIKLVMELARNTSTASLDQTPFSKEVKKAAAPCFQEHLFCPSCSQPASRGTDFRDCLFLPHALSQFPISHALDDRLQNWFCSPGFAPVASMQGSDMQAFHGQGCHRRRCLQERHKVTGSVLKTLVRSCPCRCVVFQKSGKMSFGLRRRPAIWLSMRAFHGEKEPSCCFDTRSNIHSAMQLWTEHSVRCLLQRTKSLPCPLSKAYRHNRFF